MSNVYFESLLDITILCTGMDSEVRRREIFSFKKSNLRTARDVKMIFGWLKSISQCRRRPGAPTVVR